MTQAANIVAVQPSGDTKEKRTVQIQRRQLTQLLFWIGALAIVVFCLAFVDREDRWGCALAAFPAVMIVQHAVFLRLVRMPFRRSDGSEANKQKPDTTSGAGQPERRQSAFTTALETSHKYFSAGTLAIRYGVPAVAIAIIGLAAFFALFTSSDFALHDSASKRAAELGAAGAYTYVLLYLAQRNFRHDITSGGALWCAVVMAVGPLLACALAQFVNAQLETGSMKLSGEAVYFAAGMAPRHVTSFLVEAIKRLWVSPSTPALPAPRTIPVTQVRGISTEIADRLSEEGITDLYGLATADPMRLIRNTSFDKRQIITWIDEAILIATLPDKWQAVENTGITGAIDFAWTLNDEQAVTALAKSLELDVALLRPTMIRVAEDAQLQLVWVLYNSIDSLEIELTKPP